MLVACTGSMGRNAAYACSHQLTASLISPSHHSAFPSPDNTSAVSSGRSAAPDENLARSCCPSTSSNAERASSQAPLARASCPPLRSAVEWGVPSASIAGPDRWSDTIWRIFPVEMLLFWQAGGKCGGDSGEAACGMLLSGNRGDPRPARAYLTRERPGRSSQSCHHPREERT